MSKSNYPPDWPNISKRVLAGEPMCRECSRFGISRKATQVDHVRSLSDGGTNDPANLQPLCARHHSKKTVRDARNIRRRWLPTAEGMARDEIRIQLDTMWARDGRGMIQFENDGSGTPAPLVCVAVILGSQRLIEPGAALTDAQAGAAIELLSAATGEVDADQELQLMSLLGRTSVGSRITSGPTYMFVPTLPRIPLEAGAHLLWSQDPDADDMIERLSQRRKGRLSPSFPTWAAAIVDGKIVSMCSSVRLSEKGAEAGVETAPAYRGRGYASAAAALWAEMMRASGRSHLFYSTSHDNASSQRVAQRLQLHQLGTLWTLRAPQN